MAEWLSGSVTRYPLTPLLWVILCVFPSEMN